MAERAWLPHPPQQPWATGIPWGASMPQPPGDKRVIKLIPGFAVMSGASREGSVISWPDGLAEGVGVPITGETLVQCRVLPKKENRRSVLRYVPAEAQSCSYFWEVK